MDLPSPTIEEYCRLYEAASAFKKEAPWMWMTEDEIFGIRNPETGQIGYASVMGTLGEHLALALYLGSVALDGFWRMQYGAFKENPLLPLEIPQLQASFEDRNTLYPKDREVIKSLGLSFRGKLEWPMFRSYVPGCVPWFVTPEETRFLTVALEQALNVSLRIREETDLLEAPDEEEYLVRQQTEQGWADAWVVPDPVPVRLSQAVDSQRLAAMRRDFPRQRFTLQADLFAVRSQIKEKEDPRPYLPYILIVVEADSGMVLGTDLMIAKPSLDAVWAQTQLSFLETVARLESIPHRIAVRDQRLYNLLTPIARGLGIRLRVSRRLPALDEARAAIEARM